MKRIVLSLLSIIIPFAATAQTDIELSEMEHNLGTLLWHNAGHAVFTLKNTGSTPLTIRDVEPDCGCTLATWTSEPIQPGKTGEIGARYDAEQLGHFNKAIAIYTDRDEQPFYVSLSGNVVNKTLAANDYAELNYRVSGIDISTDNIEFDNVRRGETPFQVLQVKNTTAENITPTLMHLPRYILASYAPETLYPGRVGQIVLTLDSRQVENMGLNQSTIYLGTHAGDRISADKELSLSVTLLPEIDENARNAANRPVAQFSKTDLALGSFGAKSTLKDQILITNVGNAPLTIDALQVYNPGISVKINTQTIRPGKTAKMKVSVSNNVFRFKQRPRILLITNDPAMPKVDIDVEVAR